MKSIVIVWNGVEKIVSIGCSSPRQAVSLCLVQLGMAGNAQCIFLKDV